MGAANLSHQGYKVVPVNGYRAYSKYGGTGGAGGEGWKAAAGPQPTSSPLTDNPTARIAAPSTNSPTLNFIHGFESAYKTIKGLADSGMPDLQMPGVPAA